MSNKILIKKPILIAGLPRSGTTWVGEVLCKADNIRYIFEPDNEKINAYACHSKKHLHRFPFIEPSFTDDTLDNYKKLWFEAFQGKLGTALDRKIFTSCIFPKITMIERLIGEKTGFIYIDLKMKDVEDYAKRKNYSARDDFIISCLANFLLNKPFSFSDKSQVIIKSVHSALSLSWIYTNFSPQIILVLRNPYALFASYVRMKMPDGMRNLLTQPSLLQKLKLNWKIDKLPNKGFSDEIAFQICLQYKYLEEQIKEHSNSWQLLSHDRLCANPLTIYNELFNRIGLTWNSNVESKIMNSNKVGSGFNANRISSEQPSKWKSELTGKECKAIEFWINEFKLESFIQNYIL